MKANRNWKLDSHMGYSNFYTFEITLIIDNTRELFELTKKFFKNNDNILDQNGIYETFIKYSNLENKKYTGASVKFNSKLLNYKELDGYMYNKYLEYYTHTLVI